MPQNILDYLERQARKITFGLRIHALARLGYAQAPHIVFEGINDDEWFAINTSAYRRYALLRDLLPGMPDENTQRGFIGNAGDVALSEAYAVYLLIKQAMEKYGRALDRDSKVLDFGCGWGRFTRFFMREVSPRNIYGVDPLQEAIDLCKKTNPLCQFQRIEVVPPIPFPDGTFDLIYLYSVFSHLSEEVHDRWLTEFHRIMKPGAILVATTWDRGYIERCEQVRRGHSVGMTHPMSHKAFVEPEKWLAKYDAGEFCHSPIGANMELTESFYGESCIPAGYVEKRWSDRFEPREYLYVDMRTRWQNVIVAQKKG